MPQSTFGTFWNGRFVDVQPTNLQQVYNNVMPKISEKCFQYLVASVQRIKAFLKTEGISTQCQQGVCNLSCR